VKNWKVTTQNADETVAIATRLGELAEGGDVICLSGDLGAGKTTFTQGLALGLGIPKDVPVSSPTFTIIAEHLSGHIPLYHFDVYRLSGPDDLPDIGFEDYIDSDGVTVIEWADKITDALPADRLDIKISISGDAERTWDFAAFGTRCAELLEELAKQ